MVMWAFEDERDTLAGLCGFGGVGRYHFWVQSVDIGCAVNRLVFANIADVANFSSSTLRATKVVPLDSSDPRLSNAMLLLLLRWPRAMALLDQQSRQPCHRYSPFETA